MYRRCLVLAVGFLVALGVILRAGDEGPAVKREEARRAERVAAAANMARKYDAQGRDIAAAVDSLTVLRLESVNARPLFLSAIENEIGTAMMRLGHHETAVDHFHQGLELVRVPAHYFNQAVLFVKLARAHMAMDEPALARMYYDSALVAARKRPESGRLIERLELERARFTHRTGGT